MTQEEFDALIEALFGLASASESASAAVAAATKAEQDRARAAKELSDDVEVRKLRLQGNDDEADRRALQLDQERRRAEAKKLKDLELLKSLEELFRLESEDLEKRIAGRRNGDGAGAGSRGSAGAGSRDAIASGARGLSEQTGNRLADYTLVSVGELRQLNTTQLAALDVLRQLLSMPMGGLTPPSWSPYSIQGNNNTIIQQRFSITINFYGPVTDGGREVARLTGQETKKQIGAGVDQYLGGQAAAKKATVGDNAI